MLQDLHQDLCPLFHLLPKIYSLYEIPVDLLCDLLWKPMSGSQRCAACRYLRRRCSGDCVLAPYFPSTHPQRFACVHKIFGASNITRMLQQVPVHQRAQAADSISYEAYWRVRDPVYGSVGIISQLQQEIHAKQHELARTQAQVAVHAARTHAVQGLDGAC